MHGDVDEDRLAAAVESGMASESPMERLDAIRALRELRPERAKQLARAALADEPDPALRKLLDEVEAS